MDKKVTDKKRAIMKSDADWRKQLTAEQFYITRQGGTERAFNGHYWECKAEGIYYCICCDAPLFHSNAKYDSGTGWPSFFQPIDDEAVEERTDNTLGMRRIEILCKKCGAHLGHVFPDGPQPTGQRYCMNGTALSLRGDDEKT